MNKFYSYKLKGSVYFMERPSILFFLAIILFSGMTVNCTVSRAALRINDQNNGQTIHLFQNHIIEISLKGNPTTGYSWEVGSIAPTALIQIGEPEFIPNSQMDGSEGLIIFRFQAVGKGMTTPLKLIYHRSFEKNVTPIKTFEISISIN